MLQKALQLLRDHNEIAFATCEGNIPKIRVFQIMKQEDTVLYFATFPKKSVYKQLRENPNVELLASADKMSVRCVGAVTFDVPDDVQRWIYDNNDVLTRLYTSYDKLAYFSLNIAEMDYFDLRPTPPFLKHFDLITGDTGDGYVGERDIRKRNKLMANKTENIDYILRQLMTDNVRCDKNFVEDDHWHQQAHRYEAFVEQVSIHRLLLLEFGVGFNTPVIIRFPFERMVAQYSFHGPPSSASTVTIHI